MRFPYHASKPQNIQPPPTTFSNATVIVYDNAPAIIVGATVSLDDNPAHTGVTDGTGAITFPSVPSPFNTFLHVTAAGFNTYVTTVTTATPGDQTFVVGPPGTATGAQIQLPALTAGAPGACLANLNLAQGGDPNVLFPNPSLRWWRGNFIGIRVAGLPAIPGGAADPTTVVSFLLDRYSPADQATILAAYAGRGYSHFKLSWPDSRSGNGQTIAQYVATAAAVQAAGLYPVHFLTSHTYDPVNWDISNTDAVLGALIGAGVAPIVCVGWELNSFYSPDVLHAAITHVAGICVPGSLLYVHFTNGTLAWQEDGFFTNKFWNDHIGELTGCLFQCQNPPYTNCVDKQPRLVDCQDRFAGGFGFSNNSGFGHPWDLIIDESSAEDRFNMPITEAAQNDIGFQCICSQGGVPVMGFDNGGHY